MRRNLWYNVSLKLLKYLVKVINKKLGQVSENEQKINKASTQVLYTVGF